jgi:Concanavalin A-like lectin/glucanases superfamily
MGNWFLYNKFKAQSGSSLKTHILSMKIAKSSFVLTVVLFFSAGLGMAQKTVLDQGLVAYLPLREDLTDHSDAKNPVKTSGKLVLRSGGAYFDGEGAWLELPHIDFANHPFAVSLWIKVTGENPMYGLIEQRDDNSWNHWLHLMLRGGRQPYLGFYINDAMSPQDVPAGEWCHLVFQYTGERQELWVDGRLLCARKAKGYEGLKGSTFIGKSPLWSNVPSKDFEGYMREIRIYSRALSGSEVAALYGQETGSSADLNLAAGKTGDQSSAPALSDASAAELGIPFLAINARKLVITGEAGQIYELQASSDLTQPWQPLVSLTNQNGVVEFTDANAPKFAQRFYRVRTQ